MNTKQIIAIIILTALLAMSPVTNLTAQYKTFEFLEFDTQVMTDIETRPENVDYIKSAIARELTARGLTQSDDNPDLYVNIGVVVKEEVQTRETNVRDDMRYLGQRNYSWQVQEVPVGTYNEGTATIDLVDAAKKELVWEGKASSVILKNNQKMQKRIDSGIKKAFKKFDLAKL